MAVSREFVAELSDGLANVQEFLSVDLASEHLTQPCKQKLQQHSSLVNQLLLKLQGLPPSMRPRVNTPGRKPAPLPPPAPSTTTKERAAVKPTTTKKKAEQPAVPEEEEPQDYLDWEPGQSSQPEEDRDTPQELYEEMSPKNLEEDTGEMLYEEPVQSPPPPPATEGTYMESFVVYPGGGGGGGGEGISGGDDIEESIVWEYDQAAAKLGKMRPFDLKNVLCKENLEKLGGRSHKQWQKRFCVLSGVFLYFYEKENSRTFNNRIAIPNFKPSPAPTYTFPKKRQFAIRLSAQDHLGKTKDYFFRMTSEESRQKWINALQGIHQQGKPMAASRNTSAASVTSMTLPRMPSQTHASAVPPPPMHKRTSSVGDAIEADPGGVELYEAMENMEQDVQEENYEALTEAIAPPMTTTPTTQGQRPRPEPIEPTLASEEDEGASSQEEYVDVQPQDGDLEEEYEDTTQFRSNLVSHPPPPLPPSSPPPPSSSSPAPPLPPHLHSHPPPPPPPSSPPPPPSSPPPRPATTTTQQQPLLFQMPDPYVDCSKIYTQPQQGAGLDYRKVFVAVCDFTALERDELTVRRGDLVYIEQPSAGNDWWYGELLDPNASCRVGGAGFIPSSFSSAAFELVS